VARISPLLVGRLHVALLDPRPAPVHPRVRDSHHLPVPGFACDMLATTMASESMGRFVPRCNRRAFEKSPPGVPGYFRNLIKTCGKPYY